MNEYRITIVAQCNSVLSKEDLELRLVASLFDIETEEKISDGDSKKFEVVDYLTTKVRKAD